MVLTNFVTPKIYIADVTEYDLAIETLGKLFIKPQNEVYARHVLATRNQHPSESVREYMQVLRTLSEDCNCQQVTAVQHQSENIRNSCIKGLRSRWMRQRLLEYVTPGWRKCLIKRVLLKLQRETPNRIDLRPSHLR